MDHNNIEKLSTETLFGLERLDHLQLSHNDLADLPQNFTFYCPNIKTLGIKSLFYKTFYFTLLENFQIQYSFNIKYVMTIFIDLSHNNLNSISREIFISASKLENLNLSHNLLSQIPPDLYLPGLSVLSVNNNPLSDLDLCKLRGLGQLVNLKVNNNSIMTAFLPNKKSSSYKMPHTGLITNYQVAELK